MISKEKKKYFTELLTQNLLELLAQANKIALGSAELKDRATDPLDIASLESNAGISFRITERQARLISKVNHALEKLEKGGFGICEECGGEISEKRLLARPVATMCIDCKREQEIMERRKGL
jgi:DnaK suppressor protein